jgi:hypothetical protein
MSDSARTVYLATVARLVGDPARAARIAALIDIRSLPAGKCAYRTGVSPQAASTRLTKLRAGGLLVLVAQARQRYDVRDDARDDVRANAEIA